MDKTQVPKLRFPEFDGEWSEVQLDTLMSERNVQAPKDDSYPLMAFVAHIGVTPKGDRYNRDFLINDEVGKKYKRTEIGDFIYSSNNLETGSIGLNNYGPACISPVYSIFRIGSQCNYSFLSSQLIRKQFIAKMIRYRQGVVYGQWRIHETEFLKIRVSMPSLPEQKKIVGFLVAVDARVGLLTRRRDALRAYKKGMMQRLFLQSLRFTKPDGSPFPDWDDRELGEILDYEQPTSYLVDSTDYDDTYLTPVLTAGKTFILGYTDEEFGVFEKPLPVIIFDDFTTSSKFVNFPFKAKSSAMKILKAKLVGDQIKLFFEFLQAIPYVPGDHKRHWISEFQYMVVPYPHPEEQQKIADTLTAFDVKIDAVTAQMDAMLRFKKGLLQQMFV